MVTWRSRRLHGVFPVTETVRVPWTSRGLSTPREPLDREPCSVDIPSLSSRWFQREPVSFVSTHRLVTSPVVVMDPHLHRPPSRGWGGTGNM